MQIIQTIRDKGAVIVIIVIALSLIGFILMDSKPGSDGGIFSSNSRDVGKVNGENIELSEFNRRVDLVTAQEERNGQPVTGSRVYQLREQMWNQVVAEKIFFDEMEKLGIELTPKELSAILLSSDPSNPLMRNQELLDQNGQLDMAKAQKYINDNIKNAKGDKGADADAQIVEPLKLTSAVTKYSGLLSASAYYPAWMQKKDIAEEKTFSNISYVSISYNEISDSAVKVTDDDINKYVSAHKDLFKQEEGRMISYVTFSQQPAREDSNRIRTSMEDMIAPFAADSNAANYIARNASVIEYDDNFKTKEKFNVPVIDSIINKPAGTVYGPFTDGKNYVLARVVATQPVPDSIRARHILLKTYDPQTQQQLMPDSTAKNLADSIFKAIKGGADFASLALKYSMDPTNTIGGDLGFFARGKMVPEFDAFSFSKPVGTMDVVRTVFGYHVMEVMQQKDFKPGYKIAFLGKEIVPSDATINKASLDATKASAEKDAKGLAAYAQKNGYSYLQVPTIVKENDFSIGALTDARPLVRWVFDAKKGAVSEPFNIGDQFVVAVINKVYDEGVQDAAMARTGAEPIIRNEKKGEMILAKTGATPTLEAAAAAYKKQVMQAGQDSSITMAAKIINGIGIEPKVIGASFNKNYQAKASPAFAGNTAVFVIKINSIQAKAADAPEVAAQSAAAKLAAMRNDSNNWYEGLKKLATIKDHRSKHF